MSREPTHQYCVIWDDEKGHEGLEADYKFASDWDDEDPEYLAEDAAADYHSNHDGWEVSWPVKIAIFNMKGEFLGKFEVEREYSPEFYAGKID